MALELLTEEQEEPQKESVPFVLANDPPKLKEIIGVGASTIKKLKDCGIDSVMQVATYAPSDLALKINSKKETASKLISGAKKLLRDKNYIASGLKSGTEVHEHRNKTVKKLSTQVKELDSILGGGIETQAMTEFYGEYGSGKSQICFTCMLLALQPVEKGGFGSTVMIIDTENTFERDKRFVKLAMARGFTEEQVHKEILPRVWIYKPHDVDDQETFIETIGHFIEQTKTRLIVFDGIMTLLRSEYRARGELAERQQKLSKIVAMLKKIIDIYNVAVIVTNQVSSVPDAMYGGGQQVKAVGGNIIAHASTYRIYLRKGAKTTRIARMDDSPSHARSEARFQLTEKGIEDVEE